MLLKSCRRTVGSAGVTYHRGVANPSFRDGIAMTTSARDYGEILLAWAQRPQVRPMLTPHVGPRAAAPAPLKQTHPLTGRRALHPQIRGRGHHVPRRDRVLGEIHAVWIVAHPILLTIQAISSASVAAATAK